MGSRRYRFIGSRASVEWSDSHPDQLNCEMQVESGRIMHHGLPNLEEESRAIDCADALHADGLGDSWANICPWIGQASEAKNRGAEAFLKVHLCPGAKAGTEGVCWLATCARSADAGPLWVEFE